MIIWPLLSNLNTTNSPLFIGTDEPTWMGDWNSAMTSIDTAIFQAAQSGGGMDSSVPEEVLTNIENLKTAVTRLEGNVQTLSNDNKTLVSAVQGLTTRLNRMAQNVQIKMASIDSWKVNFDGEIGDFLGAECFEFGQDMPGGWTVDRRLIYAESAIADISGSIFYEDSNVSFRLQPITILKDNVLGLPESSDYSLGIAYLGTCFTLGTNEKALLPMFGCYWGATNSCILFADCGKYDKPYVSGEKVLIPPTMSTRQFIYVDGLVRGDWTPPDTPF